MADYEGTLKVIRSAVGAVAAASIGVVFLAVLGLSMVKKEVEAQAVELFEEQ